MVNFTEIKYLLTAFRTKKTYLAFLISQLLLAIGIVPIALSSPSHFRTPSVIFLEVLLFLLLAFDLYISFYEVWLFAGCLRANFAKAKPISSTWVSS